MLLAQLGPGRAVGLGAALLAEAGQQRLAAAPPAGQEEQPEQQPATQAQPPRQRGRLQVELQGAGPDTQEHVTLMLL